MAQSKSDGKPVTIPRASKQVVIFCRQLTVLLGAGVPLVPALEILGNQCEEPLFSGVILDITDKVSSGYRLSNAMGGYPRIFSRVFLGLVHAGEQTGRLVLSLDKLSAMLEREAALRERLKSALTYPIFVLCFTIVMTLFMFYTVLPNFITIFRDMRIPLPLMTRILIFLTDSLRNPAAWCLGASALLMASVSFRRAVATPRGRLHYYLLLLSLPIVGPIMRFAALARYCWVLETILGSGINLLPSLRLAASASGSPALERDADFLIDHVKEGEPLASYYAKNADVYTRLMGHMVTAGEETSNLANACRELGRWFNVEAESRLDVLNASIEPLLMGFVALIVGSIVVSIFLPLYGYLSKLGM